MNSSSEVKMSRYSVKSGELIDCTVSGGEGKKKLCVSRNSFNLVNFSSSKLHKSKKKTKGRHKIGRNQGIKFKTCGYIITRPKAPHNTTQYILQQTIYNRSKKSLGVCGSMIGIVDITEIEKQEEQIQRMGNIHYNSQ